MYCIVLFFGHLAEKLSKEDFFLKKEDGDHHLHIYEWIYKILFIVTFSAILQLSRD